MLLPAEMAAQGGGLRVDCVRVNSAGTMVAALCSSKERARESRLYVLCFENQTTLVYDFDNVRVGGSLAGCGCCGVVCDG